MRFRVTFEIVENSLPAAALHFNRIEFFRFEGFNDDDRAAFLLCAEQNLDFASVAYRVSDFAVRFDGIVNASEVKSHAAVARFHATVKSAAGTQVVAGGGRVPVIRSAAPLGNVVRVVPVIPNFFDRGVYTGLYCDDGFVACVHSDSDVMVSV